MNPRIHYTNIQYPPLNFIYIVVIYLISDAYPIDNRPQLFPTITLISAHHYILQDTNQIARIKILNPI